MKPVSRHRFTVAATLAFCALALAGCGSDSSTNGSTTVTLLEVTVQLPQGVSCNDGGVDADFTSQTGNTVTITASGASNLRPAFVLYAPDFSTQLGGSSPNGNGKAKLVFTLTQSGTHHISGCDLNASGGPLTFKVTQPAIGG